MFILTLLEMKSSGVRSVNQIYRKERVASSQIKSGRRPPMSAAIAARGRRSPNQIDPTAA